MVVIYLCVYYLLNDWFISLTLCYINKTKRLLSGWICRSVYGDQVPIYFKQCITISMVRWAIIKDIYRHHLPPCNNTLVCRPNIMFANNVCVKITVNLFCIIAVDFLYFEEINYKWCAEFFVLLFHTVFHIFILKRFFTQTI